MHLVREVRNRLGLTQEELATRAGTSRTRLSAYEHSRTDPGLHILERIAAAAGLEIAVVPVGTRRMREQTQAIAVALRSGDEPYGLRLVAEMVGEIRTGLIDASGLEADPGSTGDQQWDALIGGVVEMLSHQRERAVPAWASAPSRFLDDMWFVTRLRSVRAAVFADTPPALATRGVFLSASSLESV